MRLLLSKVKAGADAACKSATEHAQKEKEALQGIVGKYKIEKDDVEGAFRNAQAAKDHR